jgi:hypothetical protein
MWLRLPSGKSLESLYKESYIGSKNGLASIL